MFCSRCLITPNCQNHQSFLAIAVKCAVSWNDVLKFETRGTVARRREKWMLPKFIRTTTSYFFVKTTAFHILPRQTFWEKDIDEKLSKIEASIWRNKVGLLVAVKMFLSIDLWIRCHHDNNTFSMWSKFSTRNTTLVIAVDSDHMISKVLLMRLICSRWVFWVYIHGTILH